MSDRLLAGTRKGLFVFEKKAGSRSWAVARTQFLGVNVSAILEDPRDGAVYCALEHGHFDTKLHRSTDGGATFEEIASPVYPEKPEGVEDNDPNTGTPRDWKLRKVWCLEAGHREDPGVLWAGTLPGGLFRSGDRGASWSLVRPLWDLPARREWFGGGAELPGIHTVCVHPRKKRHLTVGVSCGGVWVTEDGGKTWAARAEGMFAEFVPPERRFDPNIQDPHRIAQCRSQPECLWAQHHNGIFRTVDGGLHWTEVKAQPSVFGFGVVVHPRDPETAWFVPAVKDEMRIPPEGRVVVSRTRDGGRSFDVLGKGLPSGHAYDLVWRHAFDLDRGGRRLAFGSTTGNLFLSMNQGDSWQVLSHHLPPIHCLRFGVD